MADKAHQKDRTNRVFKSLHKPLTYLGVERTLFYFVCVGAVGAFNLFNSILAGIAVFIGGFAFGHWVTNNDPAFLHILAKSERYNVRYDAAETTAVPYVGSGVMLRLDKIIKPWKESASLNDHINLYGFWNETTFLTKSGDLGIVLSISGVDYESLDRSEQEYAVKRLEAALKAFGSGFHVYQYLFKSNRPDIPFASYDNPIVEAAIDQRRKFFEAKRDHLYQVEIFYCILLEGTRSKTGVGTALARLLHDPEGAIGELKSQFTNDSMKRLLRTHIESVLQRLDQHVQAFARQLADFMQIEVLNQHDQFKFFRRLLNYDDWRIAGKPQSTQFLDYQVVNSEIEAERDHLRVRFADKPPRIDHMVF